MEPIINERDSHNGVSNDHQAIENVPQAADYPPEIADHGNDRWHCCCCFFSQPVEYHKHHPFSLHLNFVYFVSF